MGKFDREMQLYILQAAAVAYPDTTSSEQFLNKGFFDPLQEKKVLANIHYLLEHDLITIPHSFLHDVNVALNALKVTKDGIDFLLQDDGLNAILKVTTVRFHDDAVSVLTQFINQNSPDSPDKHKFVRELQQLPYETTKHIVLELASKGLAQMPNAIQWLQTLIHHS